MPRKGNPLVMGRAQSRLVLSLKSPRDALLSEASGTEIQYQTCEPASLRVVGAPTYVDDASLCDSSGTSSATGCKFYQAACRLKSLAKILCSRAVKGMGRTLRAVKGAPSIVQVLVISSARGCAI